MITDEDQQAAEPERDDEARDAAEELSDEALENVSGGVANFKNTTSPFGDVG